MYTCKYVCVHMCAHASMDMRVRTHGGQSNLGCRPQQHYAISNVLCEEIAPRQRDHHRRRGGKNARGRG